MRCEDLLQHLETGGPLRRMRARRHAARCPRCAAAYAAFGDLKRRMAKAEPLPAEARRVWERASRDLAAGSSTSVRWGLWVGLAGGLTAACLAWMFVGRSGRPEPAGTDSAGPVVSRVVVEVIDPGEELTRLAGAVDELEEQVQRLKEQAGRQVARRQIASAIDRFGRW